MADSQISCGPIPTNNTPARKLGKPQRSLFSSQSFHNSSGKMSNLAEPSEQKKKNHLSDALLRPEFQVLGSFQSIIRDRIKISRKNFLDFQIENIRVIDIKLNYFFGKSFYN